MSLERLTDKTPTLPVVSFGGIITANMNCQFTDVIVPVQSFPCPLCPCVYSRQKALEEFSTLCVYFDGADLDSAYDPRHSVDLFGRAKIHKKIFLQLQAVALGAG